MPGGDELKGSQQKGGETVKRERRSDTSCPGGVRKGTEQIALHEEPSLLVSLKVKKKNPQASLSAKARQDRVVE